MKILQRAALVCCVVFLSSAGAVSLPVLFHAGRLDKLDRVSVPLKFIQKEAALKQNRLVPGANDSDLVEERSADENRVFIVLGISVYPGRSVSPSDYVLQVDGANIPAWEWHPPESRFLIFACWKYRDPRKSCCSFPVLLPHAGRP